LIGDKGFISKDLDEECADLAVDPQIPVKRNMPDLRPREAVSRLMRVRRRIETTIGQLAGKIFAYTMSLSFEKG
jgi:hypothetical protein